MSGGESGYGFSLTTFSPSGKLVQIEYALNAVAAGATSIGIKGRDGVVLATEKKIQSHLVDVVRAPGFFFFFFFFFFPTLGRPSLFFLLHLLIFALRI
jgi:hypothetical protein